MRQINVTIDIYSALVCTVLLFYLLSGNCSKNKLRRNFLWLCIFSLGMNIGDISNWTCEGLARSWYPAALWIGVVLYWLCTSLLLLAFTAYLIEYLSERVKVNKRFWNAAVALGILHITGSVLSIRNGMFFTIAEGNIYQRGELFWLSQTIPFLIYGVDILIFTVYHKNLSHKDFRILSSYIILPLGAEMIQAFYYGIALLNAGVTLALLIIFINIQAQLELRMERQEKELAKQNLKMERQEKELAEQRIDIMLSQIQPHFLYNALTVIRHLCGRDPQQAKDTIRDFSLFLRANMSSLKSKAPIPFEQELTHVKSYLALEQQRFQERLHIVYDITCQDFSLPPLTIQPIVENAVRHGVLKREDGGTVTIRTRETKEAYLIIVEDDGVGMGHADKTDGYAHIGIENVRGRLNALCSGTLILESKAGVGTTVTITIPKEES